jgi:hypothetical protein
MGIIPAAALDVAATYMADVLAAPVPVAVATVLAAISVIGLHILGDLLGGGPSDGHPAWLCRRLLERSPRQAVAVALLPRLPQRGPRTRTPRPAAMPVVAASRPLRGPPGQGLPSRQRDAGRASLPR